MKTYNTQAEVDADIVDGILKINDDVTFTFNVVIDGDIDADNIEAYNIKAYNIKARNIDAWNIKARNINANNIDAWSINALDISYYAFCIAYRSFECTSIKGRRENAKHFCLDGEIKIKKKEKCSCKCEHC